jgi:Galactose oxidase, central domain
VFYAIGGRTDGFDGNTDAVYAFVDGAWEERAPMPTARGGIGSGVVDGAIVVVGGEGNTDADSGVFPQSELYDPGADQWSVLSDMPTPRHGMGAAAVGSALYVPGGATVQGLGAVATHEVLRLP